ncbi:MAG: chalcone isomerase family protein [Rubrivivax sp.]
MQIRRRAWLALAQTLVMAVALPAAQAQMTMEGQHFEGQVQLGGQALQLNGVGMRSVAWLKGYLTALYLPRKARGAGEVLAMRGPKRLQMRMLQEVSTQEFVKAFDKGVKRNTPEADLPALAERMQQFDAIVAALGKVRKGDVVDLDFVPGQGLLLSVNGRRRGQPVAGDDFYAALLRIFIGDRPAQAELKAGLLGS